MALQLGFFEQAILSAADNGRSLQSELGRYMSYGEGRHQLVAETVFTDGSNPLDHLNVNGVREVGRSEAEDGVVAQLSDETGRWILIAHATQDDGVFHLISTVPRTDSRWERVERWTARTRAISRVYLDHDDFVAVGDGLARYAPVEVVKISARMVSDGSSFNRGFPARGDDTMRPSHREGVAEVEASGAAVKNMTLHVGDTIDIHLRRLAGATLYGGSYTIFREQVLRRLENAVAQRRALVTGRARMSADEHPRALSIVLANPILREPSDTGEVLTALSSVPQLTLAVFHRNPYLHFAVTDEEDGSNFDVLVTREDAIDVYPGYRSTPSALARVSQRLGEMFGALSIADAPPVKRVTLDELV